jgi:hypothetical protein
VGKIKRECFIFGFNIVMTFSFNIKAFTKTSSISQRIKSKTKLKSSQKPLFNHSNPIVRCRILKISYFWQGIPLKYTGKYVEQLV